MCPEKAISRNEFEGGYAYVVDAEKCIGCGVCAIACPMDALKLHRTERPGKPFDTDMELFMTLAQDNDRL